MWTRALAVCLLLAPGSLALAEPPAPGTLRGVVFDAAGRPRADILLSVGGQQLRSNRDGAFGAQLRAGLHSLRLLGADATTSGQVIATGIVIVAGETTEVLVDLGSHGQARASIEAPGAALLATRRRPRAGQRGFVSGRLVDARRGKPVASARVFARGTDAEAESDRDGRFRLELPAGTHELTVIHPAYANERRPGVIVTAGGETRLSLRLSPAAFALADFTITAPRLRGSTAGLLAQRQQSSTVSDVLGAQQMSQSGDSDAAGALRRVTGITVVGGKYVYVRGLGERYASTLLDGSTLPSPEPDRRVVPLDLFPTGMLESIVIQKTYTADRPGEFGGGVIRLETRGYPSVFTAQLSVSMGLNSESTFRQGYRSEGSGLDVLGFGRGARDLPAELRSASEKSKLLESNPFSPAGYSSEELERFGELLPNSWRSWRGRLWPQVGLAATLGDSGTLFGAKAGYLVSATYDHTTRRRKRDDLLNLKVGSGGIEIFDKFRSEEAEDEVTLSAILAAGLKKKGHELRATSMVVRIASDETRLTEGFDGDAQAQIRVTRLRYIERMLFFNQLRGSHPLRSLTPHRGLGVQLDWRYAFSLASRDEPDRRQLRFDQEPNDPSVWLLSDRPDGNQRFFSTLRDLNHDLGADLTFSFRPWAGLLAKLKSGAALVFKDREVDTRRYTYARGGARSRDLTIIAQPAERIFTPENIGDDGFTFSEVTRETDNYVGEQRLWAIYAQLDLPLTRTLGLGAGVRLERSDQLVRTFELFNPEATPIEGHPVTLDALPAAALTFRPFSKHVFRLAYGRTVNRPEFRELTPAVFSDVTRGIQYQGNPDLTRALIDNVDLRWEWYPRRGETVSAAVFYKHFSQPIEIVVQPAAQLTLEPQNADSATNIGVELELRKRLDFIHPWLRDLTFAGNASFIFSRVSLADRGVQTDTERPLQGQSPWVFNAQLAYENVDHGTSSTLLYNVYGPRIAQVGAAGLPNKLDEPFHQLDLVFRQRLGKFALSVKLQNIIDRRRLFTQGGRVVDGFVEGRTLSITLGARL